MYPIVIWVLSILLYAAAKLEFAIIIANSSFAATYNNILSTHITIGYKDFSLTLSVLHWINDGLMAVFFLVVGMEIKRELLIGELKSLKRTILPVAAAVGGIVVPIIIYTLFNYNQPTSNGFAIPMATDIAFSLGVLSLVGKKAPKGIVVFLTALAIVDDLGAIIVIAMFYTSEISWIYLFLSLIIFMALIAVNKLKVKSVPVFIILGLVLWFTILKSGIHATFAGVLLGMTIPGAKDSEAFKQSMLHNLEHKLSPWSAFLIMPIFALANSGVAINMNSISSAFTTPVGLGIIFGLFLGKQLGIFGVSYILVKLKIANLPSKVTKRHLYGASVLGGIGFTMSIFVSSLAFVDGTVLATAKISIIIVSVLSAIVGMVIFSSIQN